MHRDIEIDDDEMLGIDFSSLSVGGNAGLSLVHRVASTLQEAPNLIRAPGQNACYSSTLDIVSSLQHEAKTRSIHLIPCMLSPVRQTIPVWLREGRGGCNPRSMIKGCPVSVHILRLQWDDEQTNSPLDCTPVVQHRESSTRYNNPGFLLAENFPGSFRPTRGTWLRAPGLH